MPAKRPRAVVIGRNVENEDIIFRGMPAEMSPREMHIALEPVLRAWIRAASTWKQVAIGDYRALTFSIAMAPDVRVLVQFWSEPLEPVRWEVSSHRLHPQTGQWVTGTRSEPIEALGFTLSREGGKYGRQVDILVPKDVAAVARQVVDIFYNAFGYRGFQPIVARLVHEGRAELKETFEAFTPQDLSKVFTSLGFRVEAPVVEDGDLAEPRVIRFRKHGVTTLVHLWDRLEKDDSYARVRIEADIELPDEERQRLMAESNAPEECDPYTTVSVVHAFSGGVTLGWLTARIEEWDAMLREGQRALRKGRPNRPAPPPTRETIH